MTIVRPVIIVRRVIRMMAKSAVRFSVLEL